MKINHQVVVFDATDLNAESSFWAGVLGGTVDAEDDWHMDLWVDDIEAAHAEVMALGAKLLKPAAESDSADNFQVYADPAGHPFCLCWVEKAPS